MTGVELALAIVPLVIAAVEHHQTIIRKTMAVARNKAKNEQQLDFFNELHDELSLLKLTIDRVKARSVRAGYSEDQDEAIRRVLQDNAPHFQLILSRILNSIDHLVSDKSLDLTMDDITPGAMLDKLRCFHTALKSGETTNTILERFRFTRHEKTRTLALKRIQTGTKKLERFLDSSAEMFEHSNRVPRRKTNRKRTRRYSEDLFKKLATKWRGTDSCRVRHVTKLCLWNCCCLDDPEEHVGSEDSLDLIVSVDQEQKRRSWQESIIYVKEGAPSRVSSHVHWNDEASRDTTIAASHASGPGKDIDSESFCELFRQAQASNSKLRLVYDHDRFWQQKSKMICLNLRGQEEIRLKDLLGNTHSWTLRDKWTLAVVLAHAALHCSQGSWLQQGWNKEHISFFCRDGTNQPDLSRPFLSLDFRSVPVNRIDEPDLLMQHCYPALLSLGILLLEINKGVKIESCWSEEDLIDGRTPNDNTNLTTALRLLESSDSDLIIGYRKAVKACLEWNLAEDGMTNDEFGMRLYETVVEPLELELKHGFDILPEQLGLKGIRRSEKH